MSPNINRIQDMLLVAFKDIHIKDMPRYRKIPIISPGIIFVQKAFCWAYFRGSLFSEELVIGGNFAPQNGFGLSLKTLR